MIRVLNVMEDGRIAGPQLRMLRVANSLAARIFTLVAIPKKGPTQFKEALTCANVPFIQIPLTKLSRNPLDIMWSTFLMPWEIYKLVATIKYNKIDVVHSSGGAWMFKAIVAAKIANVPSVWHLNDTSSPKPFRFLARILLKHWVAGVIVAGSRVKEHYLPDYEESYKKRVKLISIEAPVDTDTFKPSSEKNTNLKTAVLTVGNVSPVKGYFTVVLAAEIIKNRADIVWSIVGSSYDSQRQYRAMLDKEMNDRKIRTLSFFGPSKNVLEQLHNCDIYVCSSEAEASPTAVWEAMAAGLPVISTDVGCVRDYVEEGVNGFLVPPGDYKSIAAHILYLADNPNLRVQMGSANVKVAKKYLDISVCAENHFKIYSEVATGIR